MNTAKQISICQSIIPPEVRFTRFREQKRRLDLRAIACFTSTGFFLEKDTYWTNETALQPGHEYEIGADGRVISERQWWRWHYAPRDISLKQAVEEFAHLFEQLVRDATEGKRVILPLSGGLDSRTLAAALRDRSSRVHAVSYQFSGGHKETEYARRISKVSGFDFTALTVPGGYLWNVLDKLAAINGCYAEFTHPRPMAFVDRFAEMGDLFLLGHWGDVLFDDMGVPDDLPFELQVEVILRKILKKGGQDLAEALWEAWGLEGRFDDYLRERVAGLLRNISIENANTGIRAFKSLYWCYRWTTVNLAVFSSVKPIFLPYYQDEMCKFICTVPERWLAGRRIQIEYLKMVAPELAKIPWQAHRPFNLYTYSWNKTPWNLPYRALDKAKRVLRTAMGKTLIQRNWELQFLGRENDQHLRTYLFERNQSKGFIPDEMVRKFYQKFKEENPVYYAHAVSMLLTLLSKDFTA